MSNMIIEGLEGFAGLLVLGMIINLIYRIRKKKSKTGTIISTIISVVAIFVCYFAIEYVSGISSQVISCVKDRIPEGYETSYGQALDAFLSDEEWSYFKSKDAPYNIIVQVNGHCKYKDSDAEMEIQFTFSSDILEADQVTKDSEFQIGYVGKNGLACSDAERIGFFYDVFAGSSDKSMGLQNDSAPVEPLETLSPEEDRLMNSDKYFNQQRVDDVSYVGNSDEGEIIVSFSVMNDTPYLNITDNGEIILDYAEANFVDENSIMYSNDDGTGGLLFIWENENLVDLENVETGAKVQLYREAG